MASAAGLRRKGLGQAFALPLEEDTREEGGAEKQAGSEEAP